MSKYGAANIKKYTYLGLPFGYFYIYIMNGDKSKTLEDYTEFTAFDNLSIVSHSNELGKNGNHFYHVDVEPGCDELIVCKLTGDGSFTFATYGSYEFDDEGDNDNKDTKTATAKDKAGPGNTEIEEGNLEDFLM